MEKSIELDATLENWKSVKNFLKEILVEKNCSRDDERTLQMAIEEIYCNIVNYAYAPHVGKVKIVGHFENDECVIILQFIDEGKPFNPLEKDEPDFTIAPEDREVGGFGIFIVREMVDNMSYEYKDRKNILTLKKNLAKG